MYCTNCGQYKNEEEFRSKIERQLLAYCAECRSKILHPSHPQRASLARILPGHERRRSTPREVTQFIDAQTERQNGSNIRLIQDASVARDLAWFFELNFPERSDHARDR